MPLPSGIQTCTVTFGGATDFAGTGLTNKIVATPSRDVIWKTGPHRLGGPSYPLSAVADVDVVGTLLLPFVDQAGFKDDTGADITGWYYELVLTLGRTSGGAQEVVRKLFSPHVGQTTVAFDDIPYATAQPALIAPAMPVTSINGQTGAITGIARMSDLAGLAPLTDPAFTGGATIDGNPVLTDADIDPTSLTYHGTGVPDPSLGDPGDSFVNSLTGEEYAKSSSGWALTGRQFAMLVAGTVPRALLPNISGAMDFTVATQAAMLALTAPDLDTQLRVVRTDTPGIFWVLNPGLNPATLGNWLQEPFDASGAAAAAQAAAIAHADSVAATLASPAAAYVAVDTDGVTYPLVNGGLTVDTDGVTYFNPPAGVARIAIDTDGTLYPVSVSGVVPA